VGIFDLTQVDELGQNPKVKELDAEYDEMVGWWKATCPLSWTDGVVPYELRSTNMVTVNVTSSNTNYQSAQERNYFVVERPTSELPWWFQYAVMALVGSAVAMSYSVVKKAWKLRIPFVLRMIDESIEMITVDKFPAPGVMLGRAEFVINKVIEYLEECGIEWEIEGKVEEEPEAVKQIGAPMARDELTAELNKIEGITPDDRMLFIEELIRMDRESQDEFIKSLREEQE
jgi:hypothetical protein